MDNIVLCLLALGFFHEWLLRSKKLLFLPFRSHCTNVLPLRNHFIRICVRQHFGNLANFNHEDDADRQQHFYSQFGVK